MGNEIVSQKWTVPINTQNGSWGLTRRNSQLTIVEKQSISGYVKFISRLFTEYNNNSSISSTYSQIFPLSLVTSVPCLMYRLEFCGIIDIIPAGSILEGTCIVFYSKSSTNTVVVAPSLTVIMLWCSIWCHRMKVTSHKTIIVLILPVFKLYCKDNYIFFLNIK